MAKSLYQQLKNIGIDEDLAHNVDKALDPAHVATKGDMVIMQEAILQTQLKAESRYHELKETMTKEFADIQVEFHSRHRHSIYAFGAILVSILTVLAVNICLHM